MRATRGRACAGRRLQHQREGPPAERPGRPEVARAGQRPDPDQEDADRQEGVPSAVVEGVGGAGRRGGAAVAGAARRRAGDAAVAGRSRGAPGARRGCARRRRRRPAARAPRRRAARRRRARGARSRRTRARRPRRAGRGRAVRAGPAPRPAGRRSGGGMWHMRCIVSTHSQAVKGGGSIADSAGVASAVMAGAPRSCVPSASVMAGAPRTSTAHVGSARWRSGAAVGAIVGSGVIWTPKPTIIPLEPLPTSVPNAQRERRPHQTLPLNAGR